MTDLWCLIFIVIHNNWSLIFIVIHNNWSLIFIMIHNTSTSQKIFSLQESIYQDYHEILMCCCANSGFTLFSVATPSRPKNLWVDTAADDKSRKRKQPATVPKCTVSGWRKLRKYNNLAWVKSPFKYNTKYQAPIPSTKYQYQVHLSTITLG